MGDVCQGLRNAVLTTGLHSKAVRSKGSFSLLPSAWRAFANYRAARTCEATWNLTQAVPLPLEGRIALKFAPVLPIVYCALGYALKKISSSRKEGDRAAFNASAARVITTLTHINRCCDHLALVAGAVSCVAIIAFGNPVIGGAGLAYMGANFICENKLTCFRGRVVIRKALFCAETLFNITMFGKVAASFNMMLWNVLPFILERRERQQLEEIARRQKPTITKEEFLQQKGDTVDRTSVLEVHLLGTTSPGSLREVLVKLKEGHSQETQRGLDALAYKICKKKIPFDEPDDYTELRTFTKQVAEAIAALPYAYRSNKQCQLAKIGALETGEEIRAALTNLRFDLRKDPTYATTLEDKVQAHLLQLRREIFDDVVRQYGDLNITDEVERLLAHTDYILNHELKREFGLPFERNSLDPISYCYLSAQKYLSPADLTYIDRVKRDLWNRYTPDAIRSRLDSQLKSDPQLSDLFDTRCDQLGERWKLGTSVVRRNRKEALNTILTEMGVFQKTQ